MLCADLASALRKLGYHATVVDHLFSGSTRFRWQLDSLRSPSVLHIANQTAISHLDIAGVLARRPLVGSRQAAASDDSSNLDRESDAALLGWIWSLPCRVINRYRPEFWFDRPAALDFWKDRFESFGLATSSSTDRIRNRSTRDATGCTKGHLAAVIGSRVVWDEGASEEVQRAAGALVGFTASLGLEYLEFRLDDSTGNPCIEEIELFPKYVEFRPSRRQAIINELVASLASAQQDLTLRTDADSWF